MTTSDYLTQPRRTEIEAALGKLMAAIEDSRTDTQLAVELAGALDISRVRSAGYECIMLAYDRYCEARLRAGGPVLSVEEEHARIWDAVDRCKQ